MVGLGGGYEITWEYMGAKLIEKDVGRNCILDFLAAEKRKGKGPKDCQG